MTTNSQTESADMTTIIDRYIAAAKKHGKATENGNSDDANAAHRELDTLLAEIVKQDIRDELVPLLTHENSAVRAKAAFHTYVLDSERSESVLKEVASEPGLVGFSAEMTLKQLISGGLTPK